MVESPVFRKIPANLILSLLFDQLPHQHEQPYHWWRQRRQLEVSICRPEQRLHYFWPAGQATGRVDRPPGGVGNFCSTSEGSISGFHHLRGWRGRSPLSHLTVPGSLLQSHTPNLEAPINIMELLGAQKDMNVKTSCWRERLRSSADLLTPGLSSNHNSTPHNQNS